MTGRQWAEMAWATEGDDLGDERTVWEHLTEWAEELGAIDALPTWGR